MLPRCSASSRHWRNWTTSRRTTVTTTSRTRSWRPSRSERPSGGLPARVVGVDPGLVGTGFAVLVSGPGGIDVLGAGVIETRASMPLSERVHAIYDGVFALLDEHAPSAVVVEDLYASYDFPRTAMLMAHASGVILMVADQKGLPVVTLAPDAVKPEIASN